MWPWKRRPEAEGLGPRGEAAAERYLKKRGYKLLGRNVRFGHLELDLVMRHGDTVVFVEVKCRASDDEVPPEDAVGPVKQQRLRAAAEHYIARHYERDTYYRFDVLSVLLPEGAKTPEIQHFENAF